MNKKKWIIVIVAVIIVGVILGLYGTFASDSSTDNVYNITLGGDNNEIVVPSNSSKTVIYKVTNTNKGRVKYGIGYSGDNIVVKVYDDSSDGMTGYVDYGETKFVKLYIENSGTSDSTASIETILGYEEGGELEGTNAVPSGYSLVSEVYEVPVNLVDYITNLYLSANPAQATVANNGIYYYYAPSVNMMNDGMNAGHEWEDGANTGNIRYYGASPANYIDIGDRDSNGNVIPWRIIGVFKNVTLADGNTDTLVKIIRDESKGYIEWNSNGTNDWNNSTLKTYLNEGEYYAGLLQIVKDKIVTVEWNLGGYDDSKIYSNDIYFYERGELKANSSFGTIWEGNIALMYPSDYGYASDLTKCAKMLEEYGSDITNCIGTDWLFNSDNQWLLTPYSLTSGSAWLVSSGNVYYGYYVNYSSYGISAVGARPVLYLNSDLVRVSGDGSSVESAYVVS